MPCEVEDIKLARFFDGELPSAEQASLARHIASCNSCTQSLHKFSAIRDMLKKEAPAVPDGLAARINSALAEEAADVDEVPPENCPDQIPHEWLHTLHSDY